MTFSSALTFVTRRLTAALCTALVGVGTLSAPAPAHAQTLGQFWSIESEKPAQPAGPLKLWLYVPLKPSDTCREGKVDELFAPESQRKLRMFEVDEAWDITWQIGTVSSPGSRGNARRPHVNPDGLCFVLEQGMSGALRGHVVSRISARRIGIEEPVLALTSRPGTRLTFNLLPGFPAKLSDPVTRDWLFLQPLTTP